MPTSSRVPAVRSTAFALAVFLGLATTACQRTSEPAANAAPTAARAQFDPTLSLADNSGSIRFDGIVDSTETKTAIERALLAAYGKGRAAGILEVDAAARASKWAAGLDEFLKTFSSVTGASVRFDGDTAVLTGQLSLDQRRALRAAAEQAFPGARLQGLFELPADPAPTQTASLLPEALTRQLNQMPVQFKPDSGEVSDDSLALVAQAADAIRSAPEGTRLLIVGPVVATSDTANDIFLSRQRAEALKVQLILNGISPAVIDTRGWGQAPDAAADGDAPPKAPPPEGAPMRFVLVR